MCRDLPNTMVSSITSYVQQEAATLSQKIVEVAITCIEHRGVTYIPSQHGFLVEFSKPSFKERCQHFHGLQRVGVPLLASVENQGRFFENYSIYFKNKDYVQQTM